MKWLCRQSAQDNAAMVMARIVDTDGLAGPQNTAKIIMLRKLDQDKTAMSIQL